MPRVPLLSNQAYVWTQNIQALNDRALEERAQCLSIGERKRAARFVHSEDTKRLIIAYSGLRLLLSKYLSLPAESFKFKTNDHGKPYLIDSPIYFNLSHSKDWVIWAFALNNELGVDIEYQKKNIEPMDLAKRFFSPKEYAMLKNTLPEERLSSFYRCWTRKEAFIKAIGKGLSYPLNKFEVPITGEVEGEEVHSIKNEPNVQKWYLYSLKVPKKYTGALMLQKRVGHIQYKKYTDSWVPM